MRLDYHNSYTIKAALRILECEFMLAIKNKDESYAREVIYTTQQLYRDFVDLTVSPGFIEKNWVYKIKIFIAYLVGKLKAEFNTPDLEKQLGEIIGE